MDRFPIIVWAGAALLGWIAGEMIIGDSFVVDWLRGINGAWVGMAQVSDGHGSMVVAQKPVHAISYGAAALGAAIVVAVGMVLKRKKGDA